VGPYNISVTQGTLSAANYSFSLTNGTLTVNKATLGVTADPKSRNYGATNPTFTATYNGFQNNESSGVIQGNPSLTTTATTNTAVGSATITAATGSLSATNYSFAFTNGTLTISKAPLGVTADPKSRAYGATNPVLTVTYSGFVNNETTNVLSGSPGVTTTAVTNSPVGGYPITVTQNSLSAANYSFNFTNNTLTVGLATLQVTADNQVRLYGATNPVLTYSFTGFQNGDNSGVVSGLAGTSTAAGTNSNVGSYPITVTNINLSAVNYTFAFNSGTLTVNKATLGVTADPKSRNYGSTNPVFTATYSGFRNSDNSGAIQGSPSLTTTATTNTPSGSATITAAVGTLSATNYLFAFTNGTLTINKAPLGVTADPKSRPYGQTNPVLTVSFSGFVNNETTNVLSGSPTISTTAVSNSPIGGYPITVTQNTLTAANYSFNFTNGTLTVGQAALLVSADPQSKTYGSTNPVLTYTISGFLGTDTVAVVGGTAAISTVADTNSGVGTYPIVVTNNNLIASNYIFAFSNSLLTVNPASLLVSADPKNKTYGATNPVLTCAFSGFQNTDTVAVVSGTAAISTTAGTNSVVGTYPITVTNGSLNASNYTFSFTNNLLTVNPATLGVTADNKARPYGQTNPVLTYTISGFQNTDTVAVVSGAAGLSTSAISNSPLGGYPIVVTNINLSASNYLFAFTNGTLTVGQAALLVSADPQSKTYGSTNPVLTYSISGFLGTDTVAVVSGTAAISTVADTNSVVGTYPIFVTNNNLTSSNYIFAFSNSLLTVNPASLLVSADPKSKTYGATNPVLTYAFSGFQNTDTVSAVSGSAAISTVADTNSGVGSYPIVVTNNNLTASNYTFAFTNNLLTVNPATLGVTADNKARPYGQTNPVLTYTISGFQNTDTVAVVSGAAGLSTSAITNSPLGGYPIVVTNINLSASNYLFTFTNGTLTVGQAALLVSADPQSKTYGSTNPVLTYSISGFLGTDTVAVVSGTAAISTVADTNSGVGTYPIVVTNNNLTASNYIFAFSNSLLTVNPASLLVSADPKNKTYGATNPVLTYAFSGFQNTDTVAVVSGTAAISTAADTNSGVGTYPIVVTNNNLVASNYIFAFSNSLLTVNPSSLLVSADPRSKTYGATNPVLTYAFSGFRHGFRGERHRGDQHYGRHQQRGGDLFHYRHQWLAQRQQLHFRLYQQSPDGEPGHLGCHG